MTNNETSEVLHRLTNLEMTVSYQENTIEAINKVVVKQQESINVLEKAVSHLVAKVQEINSSDILTTAEEPPPPHY